MTGRPLDHKYPPGLKTDVRVKANARYAGAYRLAPRGREGRIVAPTSKRDYVRVLWDGCAYDHEVHRNFFDVVRRTD